MNQNGNDKPHEFHADVSAQRLARVYAESLLNAAEKQDQAEAILAEVDSLLDDVFQNDSRLEVLLSSAAVGPNQRREAIEKAFAGRASDLFYRFLLVLNDHERLELLRPIRQALHDLFNERRHRVKVHVYAAVPLSADLEARVADTVRQRFGLDPVLVSHVDPSLLGGLRVRIGDKLFDATVRTRLENLRHQILSRSSHEIQSRRDRFSSSV